MTKLRQLYAKIYHDLEYDALFLPIINVYSLGPCRGDACTFVKVNAGPNELV